MKIEKKYLMKCAYCGKEIEGLPYKCRYCGEYFCVEHHLPENHNCPALSHPPRSMEPSMHMLNRKTFKEREGEVPVRVVRERDYYPSYKRPRLAPLYLLIVILFAISAFLTLRVFSLESELAKTKAYADTIHDKLTSLEGRLDELKSHIFSIRSDITSVKRDLLEVEAKAAKSEQLVNDAIERMENVDNDLKVVIDWLKDVINALDDLSRKLYGRAYFTKDVFSGEPSPAVRSFVDGRIYTSHERLGLKLLSQVVYRHVTYTEDPESQPILESTSETYLSSLMIGLPRYMCKSISITNTARSPSETLLLRKGDCEDYAILYAASAHYYLSKLGLKHSVAVLAFEGRMRLKLSFHAIVIGFTERDGERMWFLADPTWYGYFTYEFGEEEALVKCIQEYQGYWHICSITPYYLVSFNNEVYVSSWDDVLKELESH